MPWAQHALHKDELFHQQQSQQPCNIGRDSQWSSSIPGAPLCLPASFAGRSGPCDLFQPMGYQQGQGRVGVGCKAFPGRRAMLIWQLMRWQTLHESGFRGILQRKVSPQACGTQSMTGKQIFVVRLLGFWVSWSVQQLASVLFDLLLFLLSFLFF